jgi:predicted S18 family serine protease
LAKIAEADERLSYARIYVPEALDTADDVLAQARETQDPTLCLILASRAAANANVVVSALAIDSGGIDALLAEKLAAASRAIAEANDDGSFPILGYSYWRYAQNLRTDAPYSALSFAEEAIDLASLQLYFPKEASWRIPPEIIEPVVFFCYGAAFMVGFALLLEPAIRAPAKSRRRK